MSTSNLKPAAHDDLVRDLIRAFTRHSADYQPPSREVMADLTAHHLIEHLEADGFIFMKKPPIGGHAGSWDWLPSK
jgi:hypothetical protein